MTPETPTEAHVRTYTERLLLQRGLFGWTVKFDRAKRRAGQCDYINKVISFSRDLIKMRPIEDSLNTAKHEVAHAIVGHDHGHDHVWRDVFISLGGNGKRCYDSSKIDQERLARYVAECPAGHKYYKHKAVDDRVRRCSVCPDHPVLEYVETLTGQPMVRFKHVPRRRKGATRAIRLADGRVFRVPTHF